MGQRWAESKYIFLKFMGLKDGFLSLAIRAFIWDVILSDSHVLERKFLSLGTVVIDNSEHKILPKTKDKGEFVIIGLKRSTYTLF